MEEKVKVIKIRAGMSDPQGRLIPRGVQEQLTLEIADEVAIWYFKDRRVTKNFARVEIEGDRAKGIEPKTIYEERTGKALRAYPGKSKEQIRDEVLEELKQLNLNAKVLKNGK